MRINAVTCIHCSGPILPGEVDTVTSNPDWPEDKGARLHFHRPCWVAHSEPAPISDPVNQPAHYTWLPNGVEVIDITKHLSFCLGNVVKYTLRADRKGKAIEDLKKAQTYLRYEIERREEIARRESGV